MVSKGLLCSLGGVDKNFVAPNFVLGLEAGE